MRDLTIEESLNLRPGDDHYRAYVGPPERYDFIGASQFALLHQLGLRDFHTVLDFGSGSLRLGRMLIPFLQANRYYAIDPNKWLIEEGIVRELGQNAIDLKTPHFDFNDQFDCTVFKTQFDFVIAQSIISHSGPDLTQKLMTSIKSTLSKTGLFVFTYFKPNANVPKAFDGWLYPGCLGYEENDITAMLQNAGLVGTGLKWFHPVQNWHLAAHEASALPSQDELLQLTGAVVSKGNPNYGN
jgi:SAM-dependent methyltransferase